MHLEELPEWKPERDPKRNTGFLFGQVTGVELYYLSFFRWASYDSRGKLNALDQVRPGGVRVWTVVQNDQHFVRAYWGRMADSEQGSLALPEVSAQMDKLLGKLVQIRAHFSADRGLFMKVFREFKSPEEALSSWIEHTSPDFYRKKYMSDISPHPTIA